MEEEQKSYFAIIPANVRYSKKICANAKLLYGEITALTNEKGFCWAKNEYFTKLYGVSKTSISKWISQLESNGFIDIEYEKRGFEVVNRRIFLSLGLTKVNRSDEEKLNGSDEEKLNAINNITFNNKDNKKYSSKSSEDLLGQIKTSSETSETPDPSKKQHSLSASKTSSKNSRPASGSADKTKEPDPKYKNGWQFLTYISENKKFLKSHRPGTGVYDNAAKRFCYLLNGKFGLYFKLDEKYLDRNGVSIEDSRRKWTPEEIKEAIDNYEQTLSDTYGMSASDKLTKCCNTFLFNPATGSSIFLTKVTKNYKPYQKYEEKPLNPDILTKYRATFFKTGTNSTEEQELIKCVNFVIRREREYRKKVEGVLNLTKIMGDKFFDMHIKFLSDIYIDRNNFRLHYIGNKYHWKDYVIWIKREYGDVYDLDPDERFLEKQRMKNESTSALDKELEEARKKRERLAKAFGYDLDGPIPAF